MPYLSPTYYTIITHETKTRRRGVGGKEEREGPNSGRTFSLPDEMILERVEELHKRRETGFDEERQKIRREGKIPLNFSKALKVKGQRAFYRGEESLVLRGRINRAMILRGREESISLPEITGYSGKF